MALERKTEKMPTSQKDQLAAEAIDRWGDFQESLSSVKRKYPIHQFQAFWSATKRYAELTKADALIHKRVAAAVHGLVDYLSAERKRVPSDVLRDAERLSKPGPAWFLDTLKLLAISNALRRNVLLSSKVST
jgi:hypothetical protein